MQQERYICNGECSHCRFQKGSEFCNIDPVEGRFAHKIDKVLTNRWLGLPILFVVLFAIFQITFTIGAYPQAWLESLVDMFSELVRSRLPAGWVNAMIVDGVIRGCGAVVSFLPNIFILFFFLTLLEDSGYMARAAFLMDKLMHTIGLHGNSFIPMLLGFGCNVPAIMSARSISNRKDRTLTMLMIPFMSCSARLPVYLLLAASFFPEHKAVVMISMYAAGILLSIAFAFLMKRFKRFRRSSADDVFRLPGLRKPDTGLFWRHIWDRCLDYLQKITTVILAASVIIWALGYFPLNDGRPSESDDSYLARIGQWMEPAMEPLGFDWKMNVCILTGLPAKEAIVSTMGILYNTEDEHSLIEAMRQSGDFTPAVALAFMLFVLLYFPCIATIRTLLHELGRRWTLFSVAHSLTLAWIVAFAAKTLFSLWI